MGRSTHAPRLEERSGAKSMSIDPDSAAPSTDDELTGSWRGLYVVDGQPRDFDGLLGLRGMRWHAQTRFLAAFSQGMRRHL